MNNFTWKKHIIELSGGYDETNLKSFSQGNFYNKSIYNNNQKASDARNFVSTESPIIEPKSPSGLVQAPLMNKANIHAGSTGNAVDAGVFDRWWRPAIVDLQSASKDTAELSIENKSRLDRGIITPKTIGTSVNPSHLDLSTTFGYKPDGLTKYPLKDYFNEGTEWRKTTYEKIDSKMDKTDFEKYKGNINKLLEGDEIKPGLKKDVKDLKTKIGSLNTEAFEDRIKKVEDNLEKIIGLFKSLAPKK